MSVEFKSPKSDKIGEQTFTAGDECSHQKELGPHYHIEIEREWSAHGEDGVPSCDATFTLSVEQARDLRKDLDAFLSEAAP